MQMFGISAVAYFLMDETEQYFQGLLIDQYRHNLVYVGREEAKKPPDKILYL